MRIPLLQNPKNWRDWWLDLCGAALCVLLLAVYTELSKAILFSAAAGSMIGTALHLRSRLKKAQSENPVEGAG
ncbi:hypothetical protein [Leisingera sp. M523]|uniref:hypothetical protein n=1 Tax=Leisingera sp. M523 TaxID=2867013 RepID=UPI0021A42D78|nr:hypothetical protein [Leisingera sp. M523]UWQ28284.1 hypothetical protein K3557_16155 [Leisingera sp. M523]